MRVKKRFVGLFSVAILLTVISALTVNNLVPKPEITPVSEIAVPTPNNLLNMPVLNNPIDDGSQFSVTNPLLQATTAIPNSKAVRRPALDKNQWQTARQWFYAQRAYPAKTTPPGSQAIAFKQQAAIPTIDKTKNVAYQTPWANIGPAPTEVDDEYDSDNAQPSPYDKVSGRITSLAYNSVNNTLYAGAAGGGVWKTSNAGLSWQPLTDNQASLAISAIAIDPTNPAIIYAGTGEANNSLDSYQSVGILKSTDGGDSWTLIAQSVFGGNSGAHIAKILVDPAAPYKVWVAADNGLWLSTDSGTTFTRKLGDNTAAITDLIIDSSNSLIYATWGNPAGSPGNGLYKSSNGGSSFTKLVKATSETNSVSVGRLAISQAQQVIPDEQNKRLYLVAAASGSPGLARGTSLGMWYSSTNGDTWVQMANSFPAGGPDLFGDNAGFGVQHGDYSMFVAVDPADPKKVYIGGINIFLTTDDGATFNDKTQVYVTSSITPHPDQHAIVFYGNGTPTSFFVANDGGVYHSADGGNNWTSNNGNLAITQFYAGSTSTNFTTNPVIWAGAQGNGTQKYANNLVWTQYLSGDGGYTLVNPTNLNTVHASWPFLSLYKSSDSGNSWEATNSGLGGNQRLFIAPIVMDPTNPQRLLAGSDYLYESLDGAASWNPLSTSSLAANSAGQFGAISTIAIAPSQLSTIYVGTGDGKIWRTSLNGGTRSWQDISIPAVGRFVTALAVNPANPLDIVVTFSGFNTGSGSNHIYRSTDGGSNWNNIGGLLPNSPINSVLRHPGSGNMLYIGTDTGFYYTTDGGSHWFHYQVGLPNVVISQVFADTDFTTILVATHGRGMFKLASTVLPIDPPVLQVAPTSLQFTAMSGGVNPASQILNLSTTSSAGINWQGSITYGPGATGWLAFTPLTGLVSPGNPAAVSVNATTGSLAPGTYTAVINFIDTGANPPNPIAINVTFNVTSACPPTYQVTLSTDNGSGTTCGTLSYAIAQATQATQPVNITFAPTASNITLSGLLPVIANPNSGVIITLDGGCSVVNGRGVPGVQLTVLNGSGVATGLRLNSNVIVKGLSITKFSSYGIDISGSANKLLCNWVGTSDGLTANPNGIGVQISGANNILGETNKPESGNLISGNTGLGISVASGNDNLGYSNWIGYQKDGTTTLANNNGGVVVVDPAQIYFYEDNRVLS